MRASSWPLRAWVGRAILTGVLACGATAPEPKPTATLASSPEAATAFEAIREAFRKELGEPDAPSGPLRDLLERFLTRFPDDGQAPLARIALAIVAMQTFDFAAAERELGRTSQLEPGSAHDLWTVARARLFRLRGNPELALSLLRPLVGKSVDPLWRSLFEQELTLAAHAAKREYEAISYMDAWIRASSEEEKPATIKTVTALVAQLPKGVLVSALEALRAERANYGYGVEIERILTECLVDLAIGGGDSDLARLLLDPDGGSIALGAEAGALLGELATSRGGLNIVDGRTVGLLLPTESPGLRDESADVLRGIMWALGLPRGVRPSASQPLSPDAGLDASMAIDICGVPEEAPDVDEPRPGEGVHLVIRDDAGGADRTEAALDELAGEGASVIIAGLDAITAARALRWSEARDVPLIALVSPSAADEAAAFGFVLGARREDVLRILGRAAPALTGTAVVPVIDSSESPRFTAQGGRVDGISFGPPVPCEISASRAGDPRFPITQWDHDKTRAWLVVGSPACAADVVDELTIAHAHGVVALGLEAATSVNHSSSLHVVSAQAGVVPAMAVGDTRAKEVRSFSATLGPVGWWTALGRDAATLAGLAVRQLPTDQVGERGAVAERRTLARDRLATARTRLWSTERSGWAGEHWMKRTICATQIPAKAPR